MSIGLALSVLVFLLGLGLYFWGRTDKVRETGRLMFAVGLLVSLFQLHGGLSLNLFR